MCVLHKHRVYAELEGWVSERGVKSGGGGGGVARAVVDHPEARCRCFIHFAGAHALFTPSCHPDDRLRSIWDSDASDTRMCALPPAVPLSAPISEQ